MRERPKQLRCAVYTRKSSEEGLEQDFNSLHAQREACEAYVASQRHEGWRVLPARYDDGGFSGGTMDRPGLARLLADIALGLIDIVVVYKVDRLTRSLTDFARIVESFDVKNVSFVSVTQAFNTTSSMGRLTLNVLLSFAQFEREVTGERIRDKIAASKKKGLWMGGHVPLGYEKNGRTLVINEAEIRIVHTIFSRYLQLRSVDRLKEELDRAGFRTKLRAGRGERTVGGSLFSRGHLYRILSNPLYAGLIAHKGQTYPGQHPAIVDREVWDAVQRTLAENSHARLVKAHTKNPSLLAGLLYDEYGRKLVATHANKKGRRYRYYVSALARNPSREQEEVSSTGMERSAARWWLPAAEIEAVAVRILDSVLRDDGWVLDQAASRSDTIADRNATLKRAQDLLAQLHSSDATSRRAVILSTVSRIVLHEAEIVLQMSPGTFAGTDQRGRGDEAGIALGDRPGGARQCREQSPGASHDQPSLTVTRPVALQRRGAETRLVIEGHEPSKPERDPALIKAVAQAHRWWGDLVTGRFATIRQLAAAYGTGERYAAWVIRLVFLSPDLTRAILAGTQPPSMTLHGLLTAVDFPVAWRQQGSSSRQV